MSGRSNSKRGRKGESKTHDGKSASSKNDAEVDESSPVVQSFRIFQKQLDARHDRHERIVKLSRDVTIESKRVIFLLHRIVGSKDKEALLHEAETKLETIRKTKWREIAKEIQGQDPYQYLRAFTAGLQEYVEALSFYHYFKTGNIISLSEVESKLQFEKDEDSNDSVTETKDISITMITERTDVTSSASELKKDVPEKSNSQDAEDDKKTDDHSLDTIVDTIVKFSVHIPPIEFMLGLADLTGELMRLAINSVGGGNFELPFQLCSFLRTIHDAFLSYGNVHKELPRKVRTLKQSMRKVESACYTLQVRGSEVPKHMLVDVISAGHSYAEDDE